MSRIIKSQVVVNLTPDANPAACVQERAVDQTVIKLRQPHHVPPPRPMTKDGLRDELNRIRLDITEEEQSLRAVRQELADLRTDVRRLEEKRETLKRMDGMTLDEKTKAILQQAHQEAEKMVHGAVTQASDAVEQLKTQGYLDGLEQGATEARVQFGQEHEPDIRKLEALIAALSDMTPNLVQESETEIISLVVAVAEKVIGRTLEQDPYAVRDMLQEVMTQHRRESFVKVTISPDLLPAQSHAADQVLDAVRELGHQLDIQVDAEALPGSLVVEGEGGFTDLSVQTQLQNIHGALLEE